MDNKNDNFNLPLASFTFGKDDQNNDNTKANYLNNSNSLFINNHPKSEIENNSIQPSLSQDYFLTNRYNNYNTLLSNNFSNNLKKMIDLNKNTDNNNYNNSNSFNLNQSTKIINSNYGGEFTFGQSNELFKNLNDNNNINEGKNYFNNTFKNNYHNNLNDHNLMNNNNNETNDNNNNKMNDKTIIKNYENNLPPIFIDENKDNNNSYIISILYAIYSMKLLRKYIINLNFNNQENNHNENNNILYSLKEICLQIGTNQKININKFKESLSYSFKNRRKFIINQPDDPVDLFFVILNCIHSFSIKSPLNEISEELCNIKCFSHKYIWMDLTRIDECECNGTSRRLFSNHNYITDIPMFHIFSLINNFFKNNPNCILSDIYQKMFYYYKDILHNINMNCPLNGNRCNINKTHHRLFLANSPSFFIFNLDYNQNNNYSNIFNNYSLLNILKCFILISNSLSISLLFEENSSNKTDYNFNKYYELNGIIFISLSKIYSGAFKEYNSNNKNILYNYYIKDSNCVHFNSFYNLIFYSLKNSLIPIMLFYQERNIENNNLYNNINNNKKEILSKEDINYLEKYCIINDNLFRTINFNKIRNNENVLAIISSSNNSMKSNNSSTQNSFNRNNKNNIPSKDNINITNINKNNYYSENNNNIHHPYQYNSNTYKNKSDQKPNKIYFDSDEKRVRLSLQNPNKQIFINNNNKLTNDNNFYLINNKMNYNTNESNIIMNENIYNNNNKKYKKIKNESENKINKTPRVNNDEIPPNYMDIPMQYLQYKKEEPIAILPIQNQNSIEVNTKNNSNNYFYKNRNIIKTNSPLSNNDNREIKQKSNSYSKKIDGNFKSIINQVNQNKIQNNNSNANIDSEYNQNQNNKLLIDKDIKKINNAFYINQNNNYINNNMYNNPNSFNKNHNLRNMFKDNGRKYPFNKISKSNLDLSANRQSNFRYDNNLSNISYNSNNKHNVKNISDDIISSDEIKTKFRNKKLINQVINYSKNSKNKVNNIDYNNNNKNISKSENNANNIYNFNYIYNNNNFDMNIVGNNADKNNNYNIINKSFEKQKKNTKKNNNIINIHNISNINTDDINSNYLIEENNKIKSQNQNIIKNNGVGQWTCDYCSNINRDDFIYCKICKRNKKGKLLRINTQLMTSSHNKKYAHLMGNKPNIINNRKSEIHKSKNLQNNSISNRLINNNNNIENPTVKNYIKKSKRNTVTGFSSSKNFKNNENYNNYMDNQQQKYKNMNNHEGLKKEYSFTKGSFGDRKYNLY